MFMRDFSINFYCNVLGLENNIFSAVVNRCSMYFLGKVNSLTRVSICSFIWPVFLCLLIWQPACVCFCGLDKAALTLCLGCGLIQQVSYRVPQGPVAQPPLLPKLGTRGAPFIWAAYNLLLQLNLDCCWQINRRDLSRPVSCRDWLYPLNISICCLWRISCAGSGWSVAAPGMCWPWCFLGGAGQGQPPPVVFPRPPFLSYKAIRECCYLCWVGDSLAKPSCETNLAAASAWPGAH